MTRTLPPRFAGLALAPICAIALLTASCGGGGGGSPTSPGGNTGNTAVASVSISGNTTTVAVGATASLTATARNSAGTAVNATFAWASSNPAIATVGATSGVVTGVALGNTTISATASGFTGSRIITVTNPGGGGGPPPSSAQVDMPGTAFEPNVITLALGGTITFVFTALAHDVIFSAGSGAQDVPLTSNATLTRTFNTKGTFSMTCSVHPGMSGSITVQ